MGKNHKRLCDVPECMEEAHFIIGYIDNPRVYCAEHYDKLINTTQEN